MKTKPTHAPLRLPLALLLTLLALRPLSGWAQPTPNPPGQISYQGFLTDANGFPLATNLPRNYDVNFRLYTAPNGGTAIWGEVQTVVVDRGYFAVMLGQGAALASGEPWANNLSPFFLGANASDRYVGITVKGVSVPDAEIQPRLRLLASPYAFLAGNANTLLNPGTGQPLIGSSGANPFFNLTNATFNANNVTFNGAPTFNNGFAVGAGASITGSPVFTGTPVFSAGLQMSGGSLSLSNLPLYLRSPADLNHGLVYGNAAGWGIDGPTLFGYSGGTLGTMAGGQRNVVSWNSSGLVGIGTTAPTYTLDVAGNMRAYNVYAPGFFYSLWAGNYLALEWDSSNNNAYWSDERLKREVRTIANALQTIQQLRGVSFQWNEDGLKHLTRDIERKWKSVSGTPEDDRKLWTEKREEKYRELAKTQTGFVAQEVERVFPDWVTTDPQTGYKQIDTRHLDAVLVNAIKEQQDQIDAQQQRITALQAANAALDQRLQALERSLAGTRTKTGTGQ